MEQFTPDIHIVAIDTNDVVVTFDTAAAHDHMRGLKVVRFPRTFTEMSFTLEGFQDVVDSTVDDKKAFHGTIFLNVKFADGDATYILGTPHFSINAESKSTNRKGPVIYTFPSADALALTIRHGLSTALGRAIALYYAKEVHIDTMARMPARSATGYVAGNNVPSVPTPVTATAPNFDVHAFYGNAVPAINNDEFLDKKRFRKRLVVAAVATPIVIYLMLWIGGSIFKKTDPIQDAVAKAMTHDQRSVQSQVELTKETLKQMGLDPGKSGDVGCLAPQ